MRDITLGETVYFNFTTRAFATGIPTVLAGSQALSVLEETNATPITAGVSVEVDRASVVGLNQATIVATGGNGYEAGKGYCVYISTGTVATVSVVGEVVAQFTIAASAAATDLANGTDGLTAIKAETALILADTAEIGTAGVGLSNIGTIGTCTAVTNAVVLPAIPSNWITAAGINAAAMNGKGDWNIGKTGYALTVADWNVGKTGYQLSATGVDDIWNETLAGHVTADTTGLLLNEWQPSGRLDVVLAARMAEASINTTGGAVDTVTAVTNAVVLPTIPSNWITAAGINASALDGKGNWNIGKTGYALTTADWNVGKTGYQLSATGVDDIWNETMAGHVTADTSGLVMNELQDGGRLDLLFDAAQTDLDTLTAASGEPAQGAPPVSATDSVKIGWIYKFLRNKKTATATLISLFNDDTTTVDSKRTISDDGTTYTEGEVATGP